MAGLTCALLCVASLAVGLETAPYLVLITAWMAGRWVFRGGEARPKAMGFFLGLALLSAPLAALAPGDLTATRYDAFSGGHVVVIVVGALAWAGAMIVPGGERTRVRMLVGLAAAASLVAAASFPGLLVAPYSDVDPVLRRLWIDNLGETTSFLDHWRRSPPLAVAQIWFVALATVTAFVLAARSRDGRRDRFVLLGCLGLVGIGLTFWQTRSDAAAASIAVPIAASALALLWDAWQRGKASVLAFAAAALLLNPIIVFALVSVISGGASGHIAGAGSGPARERCEREADFAQLSRQPRGLVLNPIDQSATILARTGHSVITAANHRNAAANGRAYRAFAAPPAAAERQVREMQANYLVFCRGAGSREHLHDRTAWDAGVAAVRAGAGMAGSGAGRPPERPGGPEDACQMMILGGYAGRRRAISVREGRGFRNRRIATAAPIATATP